MKLAPISRRALFGMIAALPGATMAAVPSKVFSPSPWADALARYRAADAAWDDYIEHTYNPAVDAMEARAPVPSRSFEVTARSGQVATYRFNPLAPDDWDGQIGIFAVKARELAAQWEAYRRIIPQVRRELDMDRIETEEEAHGQATAQARQAAMIARPVTLAEVIEKGEFIREFCDGSDISDERFRALLADLSYLVVQGEA